jgi:taurine transport system substrate-binding protein
MEDSPANAAAVPHGPAPACSRRQLLRAAGAGAAAALLPFGNAMAQAEAKPAVVRVGLVTIPKIYAAGRFDGTFDKALGVPTKWVTADGASVLLPMVAAGELDLCFLGSPAIAVSVTRKLPITIVGAPEIINTSERLIARENIRSVRDLEGKRVAAPGASSMHYGLERTLAANHVDSSKVRHLMLAQPEIVAAWRRGDIDAAYLAGPFWGELLSNGGHQIASTGDLQPQTFVWNGLVAHQNFAAQHPATLVAWLQTLQHMYERYKADPNGFAQKLAADYSANPELTRDSLAGLQFPSFEEQLSPKYLGAGPSSPGPLVTSLRDQAQFLAAQGEIRANTVPDSYVPAVGYDLMRRAFPANKA